MPAHRQISSVTDKSEQRSNTEIYKQGETIQEPNVGQKFVLFVYVTLIAMLVVRRGVQLRTMKTQP